MTAAILNSTPHILELEVPLPSEAVVLVTVAGDAANFVHDHAEENGNDIVFSRESKRHGEITLVSAVFTGAELDALRKLFLANEFDVEDFFMLELLDAPCGNNDVTFDAILAKAAEHVPESIELVGVDHGVTLDWGTVVFESLTEQPVIIVEVAAVLTTTLKPESDG